MKNQNLTLEVYEKKVLESLFKTSHNQMFLERLTEYQQTEDYKNDIASDYAMGASPEACAYNLYMWV